MRERFWLLTCRKCSQNHRKLSQGYFKVVGRLVEGSRSNNAPQKRKWYISVKDIFQEIKINQSVKNTRSVLGTLWECKTNVSRTFWQPVVSWGWILPPWSWVPGTTLTEMSTLFPGTQHVENTSPKHVQFNLTPLFLIMKQIVLVTCLFIYFYQKEQKDKKNKKKTTMFTFCVERINCNDQQQESGCAALHPSRRAFFLFTKLTRSKLLISCPSQVRVLSRERVKAL